MEQKITAGRDELGGFAPKFAQLNDDVLFGEVWAREEALSARDRSIVTVTALMAGGILDSSLKFHIANAKRHGVTAGVKPVKSRMECVSSHDRLSVTMQEHFSGRAKILR